VNQFVESLTFDQSPSAISGVLPDLTDDGQALYAQVNL
jgi:hypothetical protein